MKEYDVIVIGSGSGLTIVQNALNQGLNVALIDKGPVGGTCLNVGCIPSKMLIYPADIIAQIKEAKKLGVTAEVADIDFNLIMERMRELVTEDSDQIRESLKNTKDLDFYEVEAYFTDEYTVQVDNTSISGEKIFLVSGARPLIPPIAGIEDIDYLTNETILNLKEKPESMVIIGGGYIAAEYGHFLAAMGVDVTILQRGSRLVPEEEPDISKVLQEEMQKRMSIYTDTEAVKIKKGRTYTVVGENTKTNKKVEVDCQHVLVAAGRKSNADLLQVENTGVKTDKKGYIKVNEYLETSKENIWAFGDAIGKEMFRHVANREADIAWHNSTHKDKDKVKMDYQATPHAVFSHPQIASVGLTEKEAQKHHKILVGVAHYSDVAKGIAMREEKGFAKAIVDRKNYKILGFHIVGPFAPILIQEVVNAMAVGGDLQYIGQPMHIHPALPEVVVRAFSYLREV
ncbi:MAG: dihydrolipoyl dehydrogenase [Candidatus Methanofastidiosia archaeon]|jgi:dihydrolipoamide dehydrogenase